MLLFFIYFTALVFLLYALLLLYYRYGWSKTSGFHLTDQLQAASLPRISVIIPARNEAENLPALLKALVAQTYPAESFEIIVVDDHSTDGTASIVNKFKEQYGHRNTIKLISLQDHLGGTSINSYKKKAIETAIGLCSGTLLVNTDADCTMGPQWLETIAHCYAAEQPEMIVMPVQISPAKKFIEIFQSLDFMTLQGITGAAVQQNLHSMCNGANLAYTRKSFEAVDGFRGVDHIASGDDMLLMHKIKKGFPGKIRYLRDERIIVQTKPVSNVSAFFQQRIRWASKSGQYEDRSLMPVLGLVYLFNLLLLTLGIFSIFDGKSIMIAGYALSACTAFLWLLLFKTIIELFFLWPVAGFFQQLPRLIWFPLLQPLHILYTVIAGFLGKAGRYQWKDRTVK
jgi:cellulose synthase/poly-beta-1,6-N-acetylglucosamine synthase-like glycosyltransferase